MTTKRNQARHARLKLVEEMFYRTQRTGPLQVFRSTAKPNESES